MHYFRYLRNITKNIIDVNKISMAIHVPIESNKSTDLAVNLLNSGCVIAVPTDTVYGLACDATNKQAIDNLYSIKQRNELKPVAICLGDVNSVNYWAKIDHLPNELLNSLFPGPVTLILTCAKQLDKSLSFNNKIGIRIPDYQFIRNIAINLNKPIALTSANVSNEPSSVNINEFFSLWNKISGIFDGGDLSCDGLNRSASTVVDLSKPDYYKIIRPGVAFHKIINILNNFNLKSIENE